MRNTGFSLLLLAACAITALGCRTVPALEELSSQQTESAVLAADVVSGAESIAGLSEEIAGGYDVNADLVRTAIAKLVPAARAHAEKSRALEDSLEKERVISQEARKEVSDAVLEVAAKKVENARLRGRLVSVCVFAVVLIIASAWAVYRKIRRAVLS